jgi:sulfur carrier protein
VDSFFIFKNFSVLKGGFSMITVNGKEVTLTGPLSVADYLEQNNYQIKRIAVEMNGDILPKYSYSDTMLKDGDRLEVVSFVGGG